jgi:NAD(P)-dependent dehydrogenase (short-subunit alcohol dehydrogenase family)
MSGRLQDKVCVITGAASGIGMATAERFAEEGAHVVGVDLAEGAAGELSLQADVANEDDVRGMYERAFSRFGRIDVLFNNAGINPDDDGSILETTYESWQRVQDVNVKSVFFCCKHGIPYLRERGGSVINTASFVAVMGAATSQISYTASKGAVLAMSRELGVQFAQEGIRVNALCPGPVATPLLMDLFASSPAQAQLRLVHSPRGRFGEVAEIANAALFLASDESSFVNASTFLVDGGITGAYTTPGQAAGL